MPFVQCAALFYLFTIGAAIIILYRSRKQVSRLRERLRVHGFESARASRVALREEASLRTRRIRATRWADRLKSSRLSRFIRYDPLLSLRVLKLWPVLFVVAFMVAMTVAAIARVLLETSSAYLLFFPSWVVFVRSYVAWCEAKQKSLLFSQFPDALDILVRSARIGIPLATAVIYVAENVAEPTASRFKDISERLNIGATVGEALETLVLHSPVQEYRFFAVALRLHTQTGGNIVETLETLSDTIRSRVASQSKARALLAEPKMSMTILASLPFVLMAVLVLINPGYVMPLFSSTGGHHALLFAFGLWVTGVLSMHILIKRGAP